MQFSNRIIAIAEEVKYQSLADIGTDHAYIPIYCCNNKKMQKVIACDANKEPLERGKKNIEYYNLLDKIETRLCDGLTGISVGEVETVTIGGMGGLLIMDILEERIEVVKSLKELIIQPQQHIDRVRKYIHSINFKITKEKIIIEDNKFYNILTLEKGTDVKYTETDYILGKLLIEEKNGVLKQFITIELNKIIKIKKQLSNESNRFFEMENLQKMYEEVLQCL